MFPMVRRRVPWILVFEAALMMRKRWRNLSQPDRARLAELTRKSQGRPQRLTREERAEFRRIAGDLDLIGLVREMAPLGRRFRGHR
jgi:hypothetical protein